MSERILVWGAGAIGGTVGAFLKRAGHDITFVDVVPEHVAAIRDPARGLTITGPVDEFTVVAPAFTPEELDGTWSTVFLCTKAHHTEPAAQALAPHLAPDGYVVSLQNGLCEDIIARIVGLERTIGAFINFGADWHGPGEILYGNRGAFVLGELDGRISDRLRRLHAAIAAGFEPDAIMSESVQSYLWGKLGYGSFLFAQAVGQLGIADCLARPELLPLWRKLGAEVNASAAKLGIVPKGFNGYDPKAFEPGASEEAARASVDAMVAFNRPNAKTHSGVWRDLAVRKRRTEVDVQILPMVEIGEAHGVPCPTARKLIAMIHEIEDGNRPMTDDNLTELLRA
ncbi:MAG: 2-dehydropantoate 2-reductase [Enterovirga sp.]|jgi:2-dehydropantoate 2-reductase|nr:2-dehydropantoate 2-reductase [Enterovirga sp.]